MEGEYAEQQITDTVLSICKALTVKEPSPWELTPAGKPNGFGIIYINGISKINGCPSIKAFLRSTSQWIFI